MLAQTLAHAALAIACMASVASAFRFGISPAFSASHLRSSLRRSTGSSLSMGLEQVEFIIHKDGRVEEKVTGIKGKQCHEITAMVEEALGKVTYTQPTSEQFEEEIKITTSETQKETLSTSPDYSSPNNGEGWSKY